MATNKIYAGSSIEIAKHSSPDTLELLKSVISSTFGPSQKQYQNISLEAYRSVILETQNKLNDLNAGALLVGEIEDAAGFFLAQYVETSPWSFNQPFHKKAVSFKLQSFEDGTFAAVEAGSDILVNNVIFSNAFE